MAQEYGLEPTLATIRPQEKYIVDASRRSETGALTSIDFSGYSARRTAGKRLHSPR